MDKRTQANDETVQKNAKRPNTKTTFRICGVPEHFNAPWHIAQEEGLFDKNNLKVEWQVEAGGTGAMCRALNSGTSDLAVLLTEGVYADIAKGSTNKIVSVYVSSPLCWGVHVSAGKHHGHLKEVEDLKGQRYAISRLGSGSHLMAFVDAQNHGWDPSEDVKFKTVGNLTGAREALKGGTAEAFMWEKFTTKPIVDAGEFKRIGECYTPWPCFVIAARAEVLEKHPEAVQRLLGVIRDSCTKFRANDNNASVEYVAKHHNLQLADAEEWFNGSNAVSWSCEPSISGEMLDSVGNALCKVGVLSPEQKMEAKDVVFSGTQIL